MRLVNLGFFWDQCVRLHRRKYRGDHEATCADATLVYGGLYFLAIAVMLTINKWIYFNMRLIVNVKMELREERNTANEIAGTSESTTDKRNRSSGLLILKAEEARKVELR